MRGPLAAELTMVTNRAFRIARSDRHTRDFTFNTLREAIEEVVAHFPVYRTYVASGAVDAGSALYRMGHCGRATGRAHGRPQRVRLHAGPDAGDAGAACRGGAQGGYRAFAMRFQQFTAPVTAKGVEDTAFYRFNRLVSLNDVGGDPDQFGTTVRAFHGASRIVLFPGRHDARDLDARQQALRRRPRSHRCHFRAPRSLAARRAPLEPAQPQPREVSMGAMHLRATTNTCFTRR